MRKVKLTVKGKNPQVMQHLSIRGNMVRFFILPDSINLDTLLVDDRPAIKRLRLDGDKSGVVQPAPASGGRGRGRGRGRRP